MSGKVQPSEEEIKMETEKFHSRETPKLKEIEFVHDVYNEIAQHFSQTRYKPWPIVSNFLETRKVNSFGVDVGCGNGKYIGINKKVFILGSDYSTGLIDQAKILHERESFNDIIVADGMNLPHNDSTFDFAISIAVIHHFADEKRRIDAIEEILRVLKPNGQALIYCWALEQEKSRRGYHEGMEQDILVPWVLAKKTEGKKNQPKRKGKGNKERDVEGEDLVEQENKEVIVEQIKNEEKPPVKMRFYHLYKKGELSDNCIKAGGKLVREGYERDNWWAIVEKVQ
ncbi:tRNA methyltransferase, has a role in tRNA modification [Pichia californica]|uniref:tRNA methyltransferase, has a role in tRNA modification n=1 Tax=Pichia californica TaxID=460514 RepID=A0A9P6WQI3_9ASCO|nr:tRNA methyltransferase, has a role in tRNA modification [[Candida] californica]